jgi:hypothetical protein
VPDARALGMGTESEHYGAHRVCPRCICDLYPILANVTTGNGFTMQGGSVEVYGQFWRDLGVAAADTTSVRGKSIGRMVLAETKVSIDTFVQ